MTTITATRLFVCAVMMALVGTMVSLAQGQSFLTNGLAGNYPFNDNANDVSGNGNDGIVTGAVPANDRFGVPSNAYRFSSLGDRITTANANGFPVSTNDFTVSFWVNVLSDSGTHQIFVCNGSDQQFQIHMGPLQNSQTQIGFQTGGTGAGYTPFIPWALNQWYNVQVVRFQNTNIIIYRDGVQLSQQTTTLGNQAPPGKLSLTFGYYTNTPIARQFYGSLDDIRIYNRALAPSEMSQLYQLESGPRVNLIKAVKPSFNNLTLGRNYQLQVSGGDLSNWTNQGAVFPATNTSMIYPQYWDVDNWGELFFRLQATP